MGDSSIWRPGGACNALSVSHDGLTIAAVGRDVLKIHTVEDYSFKASGERNLRSGRAAKLNLTYSSNDVSWNPIHRHLMATASSNGKVVTWDVMQSAVRFRQMRVFDDHERSVNRVIWHPSGDVLVSGSQDGTVRFRDLRAQSTASSNVLNCDLTGGAVRDVQFSPDARLLATALDNGCFQAWDPRFPSDPVISHLAHSRHPVLGVAWESASILATGSRDKSILVWDLSGQIENIAAIHTRASVSCIAWRPGHRFQIASASTVLDNQVHVWDTRSPYIPYASLQNHTDVCTDIKWKGSDALVTCSKDSTVRIQTLDCASHPRDDVCTTGLCFSGTGELCYSVETIARDRSLYEEQDFKLIDPNPSLHVNPVLSNYQFRQLACNYAWTVPPTDTAFVENTRHNVHVSERYAHKDVFHMWKIIQSLFCDMSLELEEYSDESEDDLELDYSPLTPTFGDILEKSPIPDVVDCTTNAFFEESLPRVRAAAVETILETCIRTGDIQTCVALEILCRGRISIAPLRVTQWYIAYLDLLRRHELYNIASLLLSVSSDPKIRSMNQSSTNMALGCRSCGSSMENKPGGHLLCENCYVLSAKCSLCRLNVSGPYSWCQGCGHGGHMDHIREWFKLNKQCPSGCLHQCQY